MARPITIDSGPPSSTVPSTMASAEPLFWPPSASLRSLPPERSISQSPPKKTPPPVKMPAAHPRPALLAAVCILAVTPPGAVDQPVAAEEDPTAGEDARRRPAVAGGHSDRLLDQVEGDRAD